MEEYIRRREKKNAARRSENLGSPFQQDILDGEEAREDIIVADAEPVEQPIA